MLQGSTKLLESGAIRDLLFEDYDEYPSTVHTLLVKNGYTLFYLGTRPFRPMLWPPDNRDQDHCKRIASDYVATLNPTRLCERFLRGGWKVLRQGVASPPSNQLPAEKIRLFQ